MVIFGTSPVFARMNDHSDRFAAEDRLCASVAAYLDDITHGFAQRSLMPELVNQGDAHREDDAHDLHRVLAKASRPG